jgi:mitochondrial import receptor subunit TOM20
MVHTPHPLPATLEVVLTGCEIGSDPVGAALCFYKGLKVYPEPSSLIQIYDNTVPKDILEILAIMVAQDKNLKVGNFGAGSETSDSGPGVE